MQAIPSRHPSHDLDPSTLTALIAGTAIGRTDAFARLYAITSPRLFGLAMRMTQRRDTAEDVTQDCYLRIWTQAGSFDPQRGAAMPWLCQILRNAAIDRLRRDQRPHDDIADHAETLAAPASATADRLDLQRGLAGLTTIQREAVLLSDVHGLSHTEVAARMGAPVGTVKSWIRRAHLRLRGHLATAA